jgi:hypothetical protein
MFPDECMYHPGKKVSVKCELCQRRLCKDCLIELQGRRICRQCKEEMLADLAAGREIPQDNLFGRLSSINQNQPVIVFVAGLLGFFFCGLPSIVAVAVYVDYRIKVTKGFARKSALATAGLILGVLSLLFYLIIFAVALVSE